MPSLPSASLSSVRVGSPALASFVRASSFPLWGSFLVPFGGGSCFPVASPPGSLSLRLAGSRRFARVAALRSLAAWFGLGFSAFRSGSFGLFVFVWVRRS